MVRTYESYLMRAIVTQAVLLIVCKKKMGSMCTWAFLNLWRNFVNWKRYLLKWLFKMWIQLNWVH